MPIIICKCHWCGKKLQRKTQSVYVKYHFCDLKCKAEYQRTKKPVTRKWLYEHYITKKLDCVQIAKIVKRDPKSVWSWLKDFNIPTRPRGANWKENSAFSFWLSGKPSPTLGRKLTKKQKEHIRQIALKTGRLPYKKENGPPWKGVTGPAPSSMAKWFNARTTGILSNT